METGTPFRNSNEKVLFNVATNAEAINKTVIPEANSAYYYVRCGTILRN